jgi:hypothetical protein
MHHLLPTHWVRRCVRLPNPNRHGRRLDCRSRLQVEHLENRWVPSGSYLVTGLADTNTPGTLRFVITQANVNATATAASPGMPPTSPTDQPPSA